MLGLKVHVATPGFMYIFINPDTNYYGPFEHTYGAIHWRTSNLPGATSTEENWLSFPKDPSNAEKFLS